MKLFRNFKALPTPLMGLFFLFLSVPLCSILVLDCPWHSMGYQQTARVALITLTYWIIPLAICFTLLVKHNWFFTFYLVQCGALTLHTIVAGNSQPSEMQLARFLLIGLMVYVGFIFGNKNFLYPLITQKVRFWRKATRYQIGRSIYVFNKDRENTVPARLLDCSSAGVRISIHDEDLTTFLRNCGKNDQLHALIPVEGESNNEFVLPMEVRWSANDSKGCRQFGCRVLDKKLMKAYLSVENLGAVVPLRYPNTRSLRLEQDIQETALILWLVCIALSFAVPALGAMR